MVDLDNCLRYNDNHDRAMTDADIRDSEGAKSDVGHYPPGWFKLRYRRCFLNIF